MNRPFFVVKQSENAFQTVAGFICFLLICFIRHTLLGVTVFIKKRSQQFIHALLTSYTTYFNCLPHPSESDILESSHTWFSFFRNSSTSFPKNIIFLKHRIPLSVHTISFILVCNQLVHVL